MRSRISIGVSTLIQHQPVIQIQQHLTDDVRDVLVKHFRETQAYTSNICVNVLRHRIGEHPNIVDHYEIVPISDKIPIELMEYVNIEHLESLIRQKREWLAKHDTNQPV